MIDITDEELAMIHDVLTHSEYVGLCKGMTLLYDARAGEKDDENHKARKRWSAAWTTEVEIWEATNGSSDKDV